MKLLHTADWHLGRTFYEYDRCREHIHFLTNLKKHIKELDVDVLLIAGDIFDSPNPSADSQKMYYTFLREVTAENSSLQIVIIAGNHDSAARLEAPNPLLEGMNITVRGVVKRTNDDDIDYSHLLIPLFAQGETGKIAAWCMAVPYLRQGDYPQADTYSSYSLGVGKMYKCLYEHLSAYLATIGTDKRSPIIAMGHLQATGSEISADDRSERTIIGGLEAISPDSFSPEITYTALGHLHRAQRVSGRENVRYAGSPFPMSFAEVNNKQGFTLIEIGNKQDIKIAHIEMEPLVKLLSIPHHPSSPSSLPEVFDAIQQLPDGEINANSPYLEIKVKITEPEPSLRFHIEEALKGKSVRLARIVAAVPKNEHELKTAVYEELQTINPMDMATDIFRHRFGGEEMPDEMKKLLQTVIQELAV